MVATTKMNLLTRMCQQIKKPYYNPRDIFKNKASRILIDLCKQFIISRTASVLMMDSSIERTGKVFRRNGFRKNNMHCIERENEQMRKFSSIKQGDFSAWVKEMRHTPQRYDVIYADYEGTTHVTKDNIGYHLPFIVSRKGGIVAVTIAKRQRRKGSTFLGVKKHLTKTIAMGAFQNGLRAKQLSIIDTKGCGRQGGAGMATVYYRFVKK